MKFVNLLRGGLIAGALLAASVALVQQYVSGTVKGTVAQAILAKGCEVDVGTCTVSEDGLTFVWDMGTVYQGSVYSGKIILENKGNQDIKVQAIVANVRAEGGNGEFEGQVIVPEGPITVPAQGTAEVPITVKIHPAEEPGETYEIKIVIAPFLEQE